MKYYTGNVSLFITHKSCCLHLSEVTWRHFSAALCNANINNMCMSLFSIKLPHVHNINKEHIVIYSCSAVFEPLEGCSQTAKHLVIWRMNSKVSLVLIAITFYVWFSGKPDRRSHSMHGIKLYPPHVPVSVTVLQHWTFTFIINTFKSKCQKFGNLRAGYFVRKVSLVLWWILQSKCLLCNKGFTTVSYTLSLYWCDRITQS